VKKIRTVVCGTTFGLFYLEALDRLKEQFEIVGILAKGSERSQKCAENYGVPLYTELQALPKDIELACVVVRTRALGGRGTELAAYFLEQGIHVIQEQPIHPKDLEECYKIAMKQGVCYQTGDVYPHLKEVKNFIKCAQKLNEIHGGPLYINASFAPQVSYPAMDILMGALPDIRLWDLPDNVKAGPFRILTGTLNHIPICMEIHNEVYPKDPDNNMHLLHHMELIYESGRLTLQDTFGPLLWNPRLDIPTELYNRGKVTGEVPDYMLEPTAELLGGYKNISFKDIISDVWPEAVMQDLLLMKERINNKILFRQKVQKEIICSNQWNEMTKALGYADIMERKMDKVMAGEIIKTALEEI